MLDDIKRFFPGCPLVYRITAAQPSSKSIGLALWLEGNLLFLLCFTLYLRAISKYKPLGAYIWRSDLTKGCLRHEFGGLIHGGAYFRNFTVQDM